MRVTSDDRFSSVFVEAITESRDLERFECTAVIVIHCAFVISFCLKQLHWK